MILGVKSGVGVPPAGASENVLYDQLSNGDCVNAIVVAPDTVPFESAIAVPCPELDTPRSVAPVPADFARLLITSITSHVSDATGVSVELIDVPIPVSST